MSFISVKESLKAATLEGDEILLIAVSKMQSIEAIKSVYALGQRDFGENYIQELTEKDAALKEECPEINWHFIGALQSNKVNQLIKIGKRLKAIQSVDSLNKFDKIWRAIHNNSESFDKVVDLFLQVG
jgi:PLP dependent protein